MQRLDLIVILAWVGVLVLVLMGRAALSWVGFRSLHRYRPTPPPAPAEQPPADVLPFRSRPAMDLADGAPDREGAPLPVSASTGTEPEG